MGPIGLRIFLTSPPPGNFFFFSYKQSLPRFFGSRCIFLAFLVFLFLFELGHFMLNLAPVFSFPFFLLASTFFVTPPAVFGAKFPIPFTLYALTRDSDLLFFCARVFSRFFSFPTLLPGLRAHLSDFFSPLSLLPLVFFFFVCLIEFHMELNHQYSGFFPGFFFGHDLSLDFRP